MKKKTETRVIAGVEYKQCMVKPTKRSSNPIFCGEWRPITEFSPGRSQCKMCQKLYHQEYHQNHKQEHNEKCRERHQNRTPEQIEKDRQRRRIENMTPEQIEKERVRRRIDNLTPEQIEKKRESGRIANLTPEQRERKNNSQRTKNLSPEQTEKRRQKVRVENMTPEQIKRKRLMKRKRRQDPVVKFQNLVSTMANRTIKNAGKSKNLKPTAQFLPQSPEEILEHIRSLFTLPSNLDPDGKPWMTMDNWTKYNTNTYNPNDPSTWTWHLDHIEPQSHLPYTDINSDNYIKTWDKYNLRPLKAIQNQMDSDNRTKEQIEQIKKEIKEFLEQHDKKKNST